jgi:hypothetical protein
LIQKIH